VTGFGLLAGFLGSFIIAITSVILLPFCPVGSTPVGIKLGLQPHAGLQGGSGWGLIEKLLWVGAVTLWGGLGSLLDSFLGGWFQASVVDKRTGKVVESSGGEKVLVVPSGPASMHFKKTAELRHLVLNEGEGADGVEIRNSENRTSDDGRLDISLTPPTNRLDDGARKASRFVVSGLGLLDNNDVNLLMAITMSLGAIFASAWYWSVPMASVFSGVK
jgi:uncharacterized membrane protein